MADAKKQVVVDPKKSNEQYIKDVEGIYIVPKLVREKFPDLIKLAYETESMDEEEREYWMQIMPIMSEEQIVKLRDILVNEKTQLADLDAEYKTEMAKSKRAAPEIDGAKLKEKMIKIKAAEKQHEEEEEAAEASVLKELEDL